MDGVCGLVVVVVVVVFLGHKLALRYWLYFKMLAEFSIRASRV